MSRGNPEEPRAFEGEGQEEPGTGEGDRPLRGSAGKPFIWRLRNTDIYALAMFLASVLMDYDKLLARGYAQIPEKTGTGERFEMPVMDAMVEGSKTIVRNFDFVCDKLRRKPRFVMKFFTKELAVPASIEGPRPILQGKFFPKVLNDRLKLFVGMYVLCKECGKPDTNIVEDEHGGKMLVCEACGARAPVKG